MEIFIAFLSEYLLNLWIDDQKGGASPDKRRILQTIISVGRQLRGDILFGTPTLA